VMAVEAVSARVSPPSPTTLLQIPSLATNGLKPTAVLAPGRQPASLSCNPVVPGYAGAASITPLRRLARTSAQERSPVIYNCRTKETVITSSKGIAEISYF
jgi:hypothetical protein